MLESIILYGIIAIFVLSAILLFTKAEKIKNTNRKMSLVLKNLSLNVCAIPFALFIGGMGTDSPYSTTLDFYKGFLFIQGIPLILLIRSFVFLFVKKKEIIIN